MRENQKRRVIGAHAGTAIVISTMVGTGIFTTTGLMAGMGARSGDILLAWLIGGFLALCGALCYGELGAHMTIWSIKSQPLSTLTGLGTLALGYLIYLAYTCKIKDRGAKKIK